MRSSRREKKFKKNKNSVFAVFSMIQRERERDGKTDRERER
jgi:hypothetical protein